MTNEEAKEIIEDIKYSLDISLIGTPEIKEIDNAMAMAIKSLEAWEKVKEEIEETDFTELLYLSRDVEVIKIGVLNTIKNNLKEVSE